MKFVEFQTLLSISQYRQGSQSVRGAAGTRSPLEVAACRTRQGRLKTEIDNGGQGQVGSISTYIEQPGSFDRSEVFGSNLAVRVPREGRYTREGLTHGTKNP